MIWGNREGLRKNPRGNALAKRKYIEFQVDFFTMKYFGFLLLSSGMREASYNLMYEFMHKNFEYKYIKFQAYFDSVIIPVHMTEFIQEVEKLKSYSSCWCPPLSLGHCTDTRETSMGSHHFRFVSESEFVDWLIHNVYPWI